MKGNFPTSTYNRKSSIYIIKADVCLSVCHYYDVRLTSPPVLKLWGTQGYLWLPYDLTEVINLIEETFEPSPKFFFFFQKNPLCHSFRIIVIPSILLSFFPDYCHFFRIIVIPSVLVSFLPNIVIPSELLLFKIFVILYLLIQIC